VPGAWVQHAIEKERRFMVLAHPSVMLRDPRHTSAAYPMGVPFRSRVVDVVKGYRVEEVQRKKRKPRTTSAALGGEEE
jgi:hypothetical protein